MLTTTQTRQRAVSRVVATSCVLTAVLLSAAIAVWARWGPDWPAQEFRAWSAAHYGLTAWTNSWYSGQALPGYSVIYPAIARVLGAGLTGVFAVAAASLAAMRLAPRSRFALPAYGVSVALVLGSDLLIGQVPYLLGVAAGIWALVAMQARRPRTTLVLAALCGCASPLAGTFLLLAVPALVVLTGVRRTLPLLGALSGLLVSLLVDGASGPFPFNGRIALWVIVFCVLTLALTKPSQRAMRVFIVTYGAASLLAYFVPNPIGGNVARLGQLVALPLLWHLVPHLRIRNVAVVAALAIFGASWPTWPAVSAIARGAADPSSSSAYYGGLLSYLSTQDPRQGRLEVVFTREHWEALFVAQKFPIARGWERQTDLQVNNALYSDDLTAAEYHQWLIDNAVSLVALPDAPIDYGGKPEQQLLARPPSYLIPAWHDRHWTVWRVRDARPLTTGDATLESLGPASIVLNFAAPGEATVRIRDSQLWSITSGEACVSTDDQGWLHLRSGRPGIVTLRAQLRWEVLVPQSARRCS